MASARMIEKTRRLFGYRFPPLGGLMFRSILGFLPREVDTELVPGIHAHLDLTDDTQRATYWQGLRFEWPMAAILSEWLCQGAAHFFDIGSNYGFFSFFLLSKYPELQVHAFEPNPRTFLSLSAIKNRNDLDQLHIWNCGLSDSCEILPLHRGLSDSGHSTFGHHPGLSSAATQSDPVNLIDFDTWRDRTGMLLPDESKWIAKIDVEGFEVKVLSGMRRALEARAFQGVAVEINAFTLGFCGFAPEDVYSLMKTVGYEPLRTFKRKRRSHRDPANEYFVPI